MYFYKSESSAIKKGVGVTDSDTFIEHGAVRSLPHPTHSHLNPFATSNT